MLSEEEEEDEEDDSENAVAHNRKFNVGKSKPKQASHQAGAYTGEASESSPVKAATGATRTQIFSGSQDEWTD